MIRFKIKLREDQTLASFIIKELLLFIICPFLFIMGFNIFFGFTLFSGMTLVHFIGIDIALFATKLR